MMKIKSHIMTVGDFLSGNANKQPFASRRFRSIEETETFIRKIERLGADNLTLPDVRHEMWRYKQDGGPYADLLVFHVSLRFRQRVLSYVREVGRPDVLISIGVDQYLAWWPPEISKIDTKRRKT